MNFKSPPVHINGAVLIAVLVLLMILSFMLLSLSSVLDSRLRLAQSSVTLLEQKAQAFAKLNELTYLAATQRITRAGVSQGVNAEGLQRIDGQWQHPIVGDELRLDGHVYKSGSDTAYYLQNEAGLIPVNNPDQSWLKRWLAAYTNEPAQVAELSDSLADYADPDDWRRPAGAERKEYQQAELNGPKNFLLQSCSELNRVYGFAAIIEKNPPLLSECSLSRLSSLNINNTPIHLWRKLWPRSADAVAELRSSNQWFIYPEDTLQVEPSFLALAQVYYKVLGTDTIIIHVKTGQAQYIHRVTLGQDQNPPFTLRATGTAGREHKFK